MKDFLIEQHAVAYLLVAPLILLSFFVHSTLVEISIATLAALISIQHCLKKEAWAATAWGIIGYSSLVNIVVQQLVARLGVPPS